MNDQPVSVSANETLSAIGEISQVLMSNLPLIIFVIVPLLSIGVALLFLLICELYKKLYQNLHGTIPELDLPSLITREHLGLIDLLNPIAIAIFIHKVFMAPQEKAKRTLYSVDSEGELMVIESLDQYESEKPKRSMSLADLVADDE